MILKDYLTYPSTYTMNDLKKITGLLKIHKRAKSSGHKYFLEKELKEKYGVEPADEKRYQQAPLRGECDDDEFIKYSGNII